MIKKAQVRFISIAIAILVFFFAVIFGFTYIFLRNNTVTAVKLTLSEIERDYINSGGTVVKDGGLVASHYGVDRNGNLFLESLVYDQSTFDYQSAYDLVHQSAKLDKAEGIIGKCYFICKTENDITQVVIGDVNGLLNSMQDNLIKTLITLSISLVLLGLLAWAVSFKIFQPIQEAFMRQQTFVSNASHELKTPIAIISANADVIKSNRDDQWINNVKEQSLRMEVLVNDMLSLAKIDEGRTTLNPEEFNLSDEVVSIALPYDAVAFEKGRNLIVDVQNGIVGKFDRQSVRQVLSILLDNAVKYASKDGSIIVTLTTAKRTSHPVLKVYNDGNNVPSEHAKKIFERFYRAEDSRSRDLGGSGLGLAIAKSVCEKNKWKITATPILNQSMTMTVQL